MNNPKMTVTVRRLTNKNRKTYYEGLVNLPNFAPTKLERSKGGTLYKSLSNLKTAAVAIAEKYIVDLDFVDNTKVAAKKSAR